MQKFPVSTGINVVHISHFSNPGAYGLSMKKPVACPEAGFVLSTPPCTALFYQQRLNIVLMPAYESTWPGPETWLVFTHEVGHVLGLDHTSGLSSNFMSRCAGRWSNDFDYPNQLPKILMRALALAE